MSNTLFFVHPVHRAMSRDPDEYPDPNTFKPERFLPGPGKRIPRHPEEIAFGFGRRSVSYFF